MTQKELKYKLNITNCLRLHGFPFMMPIVNQYKGDWDKAGPLVSILVHQHVELKHTEILKKIGEYVDKKEIKTAFLSIIEHDFFKLGYTREHIALEYLKQARPELQWESDLEYKWECMGIDILGHTEGGVIGVSVKGAKFRNAGPDYNKHYNKVLAHKNKGDLFTASIALVDESTAHIEWVPVKEVQHDRTTKH